MKTVAATHDTRSLTKFDPVTKMRTNLNLTYMGQHFNSPNDVAVRTDGNVYFTDPNYQLAGRTNETMITGVYRVSPGSDVSLVDGQQQQPNGITISVDQNTLSPAGTKIGSVTGVGSCTNVAFGGADRKTLYITSAAGPSAALYAVQLAVPGYPY
jgi:gluconolactonase